MAEQNALPQRRIPALEREVSALGLGCMGFSWAYVDPDARDELAGIELIRYAAKRGVSFFDTSDAYGDGHNELLVGAALDGQLDEVLVATKGGLIGDYYEGRPRMRRNGRPEHLRKALDASLERLGTDHVDLYYLHRVDPAVPIEESWGALAELVATGKVGAIGLSEVSADQATSCHAIHPVAAIQSELSLWTRDPLPDSDGTNADGEQVGDLLGWTRAHGAIFVPFSPLGRGFLTGRLSSSFSKGDFRAGLPRFADEAARANQAIVDEVERIAQARQSTSAAVALAWVLAQGEHVIPIPGTTRRANLDANLLGADLTLSAEELAALDALPPAVGARY